MNPYITIKKTGLLISLALSVLALPLSAIACDYGGSACGQSMINGGKAIIPPHGRLEWRYTFPWATEYDNDVNVFCSFTTGNNSNIRFNSQNYTTISGPSGDEILKKATAHFIGIVGAYQRGSRFIFTNNTDVYVGIDCENIINNA